MASGLSISWFLMAYLASLVLPYFPGIAATVLLGKWESAVHESYLNRYLRQFRGRIDLWRNGVVRANTMGLVSQELPQVSEGWTNYQFNLFATSMNVVLNLAVVGLVVEKSFLWAFAVSLGVSAVAIKLSSSRVKELGDRAQQARIKLSGLVAESWSVVVLGNVVSEFDFHKNLNKAFSENKKLGLSLIKFTNMVFFGDGFGGFCSNSI